MEKQSYMASQKQLVFDYTKSQLIQLKESAKLSKLDRLRVMFSRINLFSLYSSYDKNFANNYQTQKI